jgi:uncharacterized NAD(P)/FAD-binding protein YdhS
MLGPHSHIVIVGGGFSGTLLAVNLVRHAGPRVTLVERRPAQVARGVAYGAAEPGQILNVRAGGMSAFPDDAGHFARWLDARGHGAGTAFVERRLYGRYLAELLAQAVSDGAGRLTVIEDEVCDVRGDAVVLARGETLAADAVVLAVGNLPPHVPGGIEPTELPAGVYVNDPWSEDAYAGLSSDATVLLLGTGLTAVDVALAFDARRFGGRVVALSRRGLVPRRHQDGQPPATGLDTAPVGTLSTLLGAGRRRATEIGWRGAVDELRPVTQWLWGGADVATRARFIRHMRPFWDVHRHRLAPHVADRLEAMRAAGRLVTTAGKIVRVRGVSDAAEISWRPRHREATETLPVARIVNCTGPMGDLTRTDDALLQRLHAAGAIRPDALRLGVDADAQSRVIAADGTASDALYCIGPMTRGGFWEIVAVPDIRRQAWTLARRLANAEWVGEGL